MLRTPVRYDDYSESTCLLPWFPGGMIFLAHSSVYTCLHVSVFDAGRKVEVLVLKLHIISFSDCIFVCHVTNK